MVMDMVETVIALLMIVNHEIKEHRIQPSMSDCLKGKRIANREVKDHIEYKCKIKHIYHFSDLHIHLYKRHQEYKNVFKSLLQYLKSEKEKLNINSEKNVNRVTSLEKQLKAKTQTTDLQRKVLGWQPKVLQDIEELIPDQN